MCRSRRELSNEYLLAKIGVDTAENEPLEVWGKIQFMIHSPPQAHHVRVRDDPVPARQPLDPRRRKLAEGDRLVRAVLQARVRERPVVGEPIRVARHVPVGPEAQEDPLPLRGSRGTVTNFRRLVLGCMDSYDSEQRRINFSSIFKIYAIFILLHRCNLKISTTRGGHRERIRWRA